MILFTLQTQDRTKRKNGDFWIKITAVYCIIMGDPFLPFDGQKDNFDMIVE